MVITDVHALGLEAAQGSSFVDAFYWDLDEETRAWSQRFFERHKAMPTSDPAGVYSSVLDYLKAIKLFYHLANIGDARSLAIHPSTTTHSQLSLEDQLATGVTPGYVRLSIGLEHPNDLIADLDRAIALS